MIMVKLYAIVSSRDICAETELFMARLAIPNTPWKIPGHQVSLRKCVVSSGFIGKTRLSLAMRRYLKRKDETRNLDWYIIPIDKVPVNFTDSGKEDE